MIEVGSAAFKITHIGSKIAGKEIKKAAETHGPSVKQEIDSFRHELYELSMAESIQDGRTYDQAITGLDLNK